jgi:hypothetical protein
MVPDRLLVAVAVETLNELLKLAVAVAPLLAAAVPCPAAEAAPELLRLLPALLSLFWSDWFLLSDWFRLSELLSCVAVEYSLALGPAPVCVDVAVAV